MRSINKSYRVVSGIGCAGMPLIYAHVFVTSVKEFLQLEPDRISRVLLKERDKDSSVHTLSPLCEAKQDWGCSFYRGRLWEMMQEMASVICGRILTVSEVLLYSLILSLRWHGVQVSSGEMRESVQIKYFLFQPGGRVELRLTRLQMRESI